MLNHHSRQKRRRRKVTKDWLSSMLARCGGLFQFVHPVCVCEPHGPRRGRCSGKWKTKIAKSASKTGSLVLDLNLQSVDQVQHSSEISTVQVYN